MKKWAPLIGLVLLGSVSMAAPLNVVATTPDLADLVRQVGGDRVAVACLSKGNQDPHFVEAKPSLILKVRDADLFIQNGLDLEAGWAPLLVQGSRNAKVQRGARGFLDASSSILPLDVPANVSRSGGDVHPGGNPHYLGDPDNALRVAQGIAAKLGELDPASAEFYSHRTEEFARGLKAKLADWDQRMAPVRGTLFVSYHKNLVYFARRFGLVSVGEIEPKPGIPPSPGHTAELIDLMKTRKVPLILTMPHFEDRTPASLAKATGARVVTLALVPDAVPEARDYVAAVEYNVAAILRAVGR